MDKRTKRKSIVSEKAIYCENAQYIIFNASHLGSAENGIWNNNHTVENSKTEQPKEITVLKSVFGSAENCKYALLLQRFDLTRFQYSLQNNFLSEMIRIFNALVCLVTCSILKLRHFFKKRKLIAADGRTNEILPALEVKICKRNC